MPKAHSVITYYRSQGFSVVPVIKDNGLAARVFKFKNIGYVPIETIYADDVQNVFDDLSSLIAGLDYAIIKHKEAIFYYEEEDYINSFNALRDYLKKPRISNNSAMKAYLNEEEEGDGVFFGYVGFIPKNIYEFKKAIRIKGVKEKMQALQKTRDLLLSDFATNKVKLGMKL